ncbi:MAG: hypothetical protein Q4P32_05470, partial [Micrococcales bacterium]|nr:hypothetical protein [Micrococcales bacterium]
MRIADGGGANWPATGWLGSVTCGAARSTPTVEVAGVWSNAWSAAVRWAASAARVEVAMVED